MKEEIVKIIERLKRVDGMWEKDICRWKEIDYEPLLRKYEGCRFGISFGIEMLEELLGEVE